MSKRIRVRRSQDRGHANHGWLNTYHTFSFAMYHDPRFSGWSSLRVLNEDRVKPSQGFGAHPHRDYEIFSYVVSGSLEHRDSMGNQEVIKRGGVQFTSAGSGIMHSEYNHSKKKPVHFLQIWLKPSKKGLEPNYQTVVFTDEDKKGKLCLIVASKEHIERMQKQRQILAGEDSPAKVKTPITVNQDAKVFASLLAKGEEVTYEFSQDRCGYLHVCDTGGRLRLLENRSDEEIVFSGGDGAFIEPGTRIQLIGGNEEEDKRAEFILFDLAKEKSGFW